MNNHYQVAVVGSGSGGREAALLAARKGLRTAVIERDKVGGISFHRGCYAVRALQACAREYRNGIRSDQFGSKVELLKVRLADWRRSQTEASQRMAECFAGEARKLNIELHHGHAEFVGDKTLRIIGEQGKYSISAENIVIATGSRPAFHGSSNPRLLNSEEFMALSKIPSRLAIVGAGYIGCEFASICRTLGCEVTILEKESRVLPAWESEGSDRVRRALEDRGVQVLVEFPVRFEQVEATADGVLVLSANGKSVESDLVLVATGRRANTMDLGLESIGLKLSSSIPVDQQMRANGTSGIYAVGDVNGISMLDSTAFAQANVAINAILGQATRYDGRWIPRSVHTDPAIASVGWTEEEAAAEGFTYVVVKDTIELVSDSERSVVDPEVTFVKVVIDARSMHILGCLVVGEHAAVIANCASLAMRTGLSVQSLREVPLAQPSAIDALFYVLRKLN